MMMGSISHMMGSISHLLEVSESLWVHHSLREPHVAIALQRTANRRPARCDATIHRADPLIEPHQLFTDLHDRLWAQSTIGSERLWLQTHRGDDREWVSSLKHKIPTCESYAE